MTDEVVADRATLLLYLTILAGSVEKDEDGKVMYDEITLYLGVHVNPAGDLTCKNSYAISFTPPFSQWRCIEGAMLKMGRNYILHPPEDGFLISHAARLSLQGMIDMLSASQATDVRFQYQAKKAPPKSEMKIFTDGDTPRVIK